MKKVKVNGIYTAIPDDILLDVTSLQLGKKISVKDIVIEGLKMVSPADMCVAQVRVTRGASETAATEAAE